MSIERKQGRKPTFTTPAVDSTTAKVVHFLPELMSCRKVRDLIQCNLLSKGELGRPQ